jgi:hypothetical protein
VLFVPDASRGKAKIGNSDFLNLKKSHRLKMDYRNISESENLNRKFKRDGLCRKTKESAMSL